jgi:acyl-CoA synthetase (AMP-forming)/AMP-acid ligase II
VGFNLADLFESVAAAVGDRDAVVCGSLRLTYRELDERSNRLARVLAQSGVRSGDRVAVALRNRTEHLEALLAAWKVGAAAVNVNYRYVVAELAALFADAEPAAIIHEPDLAGAVAVASPRLDRRPTQLATGERYEEALAPSSAAPLVVERSGDDVYLLYTGGTTGPPRAVMWRHEDLFFSALHSGRPDVEPVTSPADVVELARIGRSRCLPACPLMHGTAQWMALSTLLFGGTVVLVDQPALVPERVWDAVDAERVSFLVIVGDAFARPLADALDREPDNWALSSLTVVVSGGAPLTPDVAQSLLAHLPGAVAVDGYGTSETGGHGRRVLSPGEQRVGLSRFMVSDDTVVLGDDGRPVAPGSGEVGSIARKGRVPLGYWRDAERTAATFPVIDGVRYAVPGDQAIVDEDGTVVLLGRGALSINSGGEKIHPEEVESVLHAHPGVVDAVVVGLPDERWGQRVTAIVQVRPDAGVTLEDLDEHCRQRLAGYKVPRRILLTDHVERSASGKADYRWARQAAAEFGRHQSVP